MRAQWRQLTPVNVYLLGKLFILILGYVLGIKGKVELEMVLCLWRMF